ncbi:L-lactate dehydrogenase complex protein LldE [Consotaella salsifontis]|uniref:L-lactate dehydrogenase complex protein LldE n=2 Tax=Consotaella salsifontis TaxID=1365950 RepID=A0A1T4L2V1_9HYPH|nr:L-lactate dehydrogenase complex protein LldE [Consotaella salsifontis]
MTARLRVGLFVTCLVDLFRPSVGFATVKLLEDAGCVVEVPEAQTCCGQPALNSGDRSDAAALARQVIDVFENYDYVVAPSGSCAATMRNDYPSLLEDDPAYAARAVTFSAKVFELTSFLADICRVTHLEARVEANVTYHDSCSSLRGLGIRAAPRRLLSSVEGVTLTEMPETEVCCGFGGTFCVKYPDISNAMVAKKAANAKATGARMLLSGDLGCLMNIDGKLKRDGVDIEVRHVAEVLAGMVDTPPIGGKS